LRINIKEDNNVIFVGGLHVVIIDYTKYGIWFESDVITKTDPFPTINSGVRSLIANGTFERRCGAVINNSISYSNKFGGKICNILYGNVRSLKKYNATAIMSSINATTQGQTATASIAD
jgi:hypothetical protein